MMNPFLAFGLGAVFGAALAYAVSCFLSIGHEEGDD